MAVKDIDQLFDNILKDSKKVATEAVSKAARRIEKDMVKIAKTCLQRYYDNYQPKKYDRSHHLHKALKPIYNNLSERGNISFEVGVEYDSSRLEGWYYSNSQYHQSGNKWISVKSLSTADNPVTGSNFGIPEPGWILFNYLTGVHPWGSQDTKSTNKILKDYVNKEVEKRINKYISNSMESSIMNRL
jgi:hypothetical protein